MPENKPQRPFWVVFTNGQSVCVEAADEESAAQIATKETGHEVRSTKCLPYPASPRVGPTSHCPSFCWNPDQCAGKRSCPRARACDD